MVANWAGDQIQGDRTRQEDVFAILEGVGDGGVVLVLADGMGGHAGGKEAAQCVLEGFVSAVKASSAPLERRLAPALDAANRALARLKAERPNYADAGCTLVAVAIEHNAMSWISVGDSPFFLLRDGTLQRLNADHSMRAVLADMVQLGRMSGETAQSHPNRSALRSAMTGEQPDLIDKPVAPMDLCAWDQLLLGSDGLEVLQPQTIVDLLTEHRADAPAVAVGAILQQVIKSKAPHQDNTTVLIYGAGRSPSSPHRKLTKAWWLVPIAVLLIGFALAWLNL
jgi:serine/threonine protein phosphatase PrpC